MSMHLFRCASILTSCTHQPHNYNQAHAKPLVTPCGRCNLGNVSVSEFQPIPEFSEQANNPEWKAWLFLNWAKERCIYPFRKTKCVVWCDLWHHSVVVRRVLYRFRLHSLITQVDYDVMIMAGWSHTTVTVFSQVTVLFRPMFTSEVFYLDKMLQDTNISKCFVTHTVQICTTRK